MYLCYHYVVWFVVTSGRHLKHLKFICYFGHYKWLIHKTFMNDRKLIENVFNVFYFVNWHFRYSKKGSNNSCFKKVKQTFLGVSFSMINIEVQQVNILEIPAFISINHFWSFISGPETKKLGFNTISDSLLITISSFRTICSYFFPTNFVLAISRKLSNQF